MKYCYLILALLLLLCLFHLPYGFYILVRFIAMVIFGVMAVNFYNEDKMPLSIISGALALLFQPLVKIHLGKEVWNIVDVIVAICLIALAVGEFIKLNNKDKR